MGAPAENPSNAMQTTAHLRPRLWARPLFLRGTSLDVHRDADHVARSRTDYDLIRPAERPGLQSAVLASAACDCISACRQPRQLAGALRARHSETGEECRGTKSSRASSTSKGSYVVIDDADIRKAAPSTQTVEIEAFCDRARSIRCIREAVLPVPRKSREGLRAAARSAAKTTRSARASGDPHAPVLAALCARRRADAGPDALPQESSS